MSGVRDIGATSGAPLMCQTFDHAQDKPTGYSYIFGVRATRYKKSRSKTAIASEKDLSNSLKYCNALVHLLPNKPLPYYDRGHGIFAFGRDSCN